MGFALLNRRVAERYMRVQEKALMHVERRLDSEETADEDKDAIALALMPSMKTTLTAVLKPGGDTGEGRSLSVDKLLSDSTDAIAEASAAARGERRDS